MEVQPIIIEDLKLEKAIFYQKENYILLTQDRKKDLFCWVFKLSSPSDSIGALKMYILEKRILGTQMWMLGFSLCYLKTAKKTVQSSKNAEKWPKPFPHLAHISYKDKSSGKFLFKKKVTL